MIPHDNSIWTLATALAFWIMQKALDLIPYVDPWSVPSEPPAWFLEHNGYWDWVWNLTGGRPNSTLCSRALETLFAVFGDWAEEISPYVLDLALQQVNNVIGWLPSPYTSVSAWLDFFVAHVGTSGLAHWANLVDAVHWLRSTFPTSIRDGIATWGDIWSEIRTGVQEWVTATYAYLIGLGEYAYSWVLEIGEPILAWWNSANVWLSDFILNAPYRVAGWLGEPWTWVLGFHVNPFGYVVGLLNPWWTQLVNFCGDPIQFWYNMWNYYDDTIGPFFADPLGWLYDRVESLLVDRW